MLQQLVLCYSFGSLQKKKAEAKRLSLEEQNYEKLTDLFVSPAQHLSQRLQIASNKYKTGITVTVDTKPNRQSWTRVTLGLELSEAHAMIKRAHQHL